MHSYSNLFTFYFSGYFFLEVGAIYLTQVGNDTVVFEVIYGFMWKIVYHNQREPLLSGYSNFHSFSKIFLFGFEISNVTWFLAWPLISRWTVRPVCCHCFFVILVFFLATEITSVYMYQGGAAWTFIIFYSVIHASQNVQTTQNCSDNMIINCKSDLKSSTPIL